MKAFVQHPVYGTIIYNEGFWSGKRSLTINGIDARSVSKKDFVIEDKNATITGSYLSGANLQIDGEAVVLTARAKWYEIILSILSLIFLMTWGNSAELCTIFPVVGGALGGALGGLSVFASLLLMKKSKSSMIKVLIGLGVFAATIAIAFVLAIMMVFLILG